jgi:putative transposase
MNIFHKRQGQMDAQICYFYTDSIYQFRNLLTDDNCKMIVIRSFQYLVTNELVKIFGYVIMPNHIHILWNILRANGKESPAGSFAKYTAHEFKRYLMIENPGLLMDFKSEKPDRNYQFWKRDPLAIQMSSENIFISKLDYIHNNPVREKWMLSEYPEQYRWSSAKFYLTGFDEFGILSHFKD